MRMTSLKINVTLSNQNELLKSIYKLVVVLVLFFLKVVRLFYREVETSVKEEDLETEDRL